MEPQDPCQLPARVLAGLVRQRKIGALELLDAHLARIDERDPTLTAVVSIDREAARTRAREADAALARGEVWGPLHGVPMTLKDGHDVAGLRTTLGTKELDRVAGEDGAVAARLRAAGAILFGHTNVAPWLADYQSSNPLFGRTSNPWNPERTAGGSSGGAAAALAAGMTPLEVCSDLAGSLRLPAHFCGVYGLKTTERRVSSTGFFRIDGVPRSVRIMSCLGPMARDLGDLELALSLIAGPDGRDSEVPPVSLAPFSRREVRDLRLAVAPTTPGVTVARRLREEVERVAAGAADAGARVEARLPDVEWEALNHLFGDLLATITGLFAPGSDLRDEQRTLAWYFEALDRRDRFMSAWDAFFGEFDALLLPPAMTSAFPHCPPYSAIDVDGRQVGYPDSGLLLVFGNLAGLPALAAPAGLDDDGLPVGVQIVGPRWSETALLEICGALEEVEILPGFRPPPLRDGWRRRGS